MFSAGIAFYVAKRDRPNLDIGLFKHINAPFFEKATTLPRSNVLVIEVRNIGRRPLALAATRTVSLLLENGEEFELLDTAKPDPLWPNLYRYSERPSGDLLPEATSFRVTINRDYWETLLEHGKVSRCIGVRVRDKIGQIKDKRLPPDLSTYFNGPIS